MIRAVFAVLVLGASGLEQSSVADTCSLYAIEDDKCGQSDLDCKYAPYAKKFQSSLKDGTCASQGYTVKGETTTKQVPVVGTITITMYTKPSEIPGGIAIATYTKPS